MKTKVLFGLLLSSSSIMAQTGLTYSTHAPVPGESYTVMVYDSVAALNHSTGQNQTWDFDTPVAANPANAYAVLYDFPGNQNSPANVAVVEVRPTNKFHYYMDQSTMEFRKIEEGTDYISLSSGLTYRNWNFNYGNTISDNGIGALFTSQPNVPSPVNVNPDITVAASGTGTLIAPDGTTYSNVIQVIDTLV